MSGKVSIKSSRNPLSGQKNRSSNNFAIHGLSGRSLKWSCSNPDARFHVWKDKTGKDGTLFDDRELHDGYYTKVFSDENIYISRPSSSSDFTVTVEGVEDIGVTSEPHPSNGQNHRSSMNFEIKNVHTKSLLWRCPEGVSFKVWKDISGGKDEEVFGEGVRLSDGVITPVISGDRFYISDPSHASQPFNVLVEPSNLTAVVSGPSPLPGQNNRSSCNFSTNDFRGESMRWHCPKNVRFEVRIDVPNGGADKKLFDEFPIFDGCITPLIKSDSLYISEPTGASGCFNVVVEPIRQLAVGSDCKPYGNQKNRSSANFSTEGLVGNSLLWHCPEGARFEVWVDKAVATDDKLYDSFPIFDGCITPMVKSNSLYISKPQNIDHPFNVFVEDIGNIGVGSDYKPYGNQNNRSSANFSTKKLEGKSLLWHCPKNARFEIWEDKTVAKDKRLLYEFPIFDGCITPMIKSDVIYISQPSHIDHPFTVTVETVDVTGIGSECKSLDEQKHRSSANFSTMDLKGKCLLWHCSNGARFQVQEDIKHGNDDRLFKKQFLFDGCLTPMVNSSALYISDPKQTDSPFTVVVEGVDAVGIGSDCKHLDGQTHRSSDNFFIPAGKYIIDCPEGVSFDIQSDIKMGIDLKHCKGLKSGGVVTLQTIDDAYISNPKGTDVPFTVYLKNVDYDNENWMSHVDDEAKMSELSILGTHDSGTASVKSFGLITKVIKDLAICQKSPISKQLRDGVRFLDIRLHEFKDELELFHGVVRCNLTFKEVLQQCSDFLKKNPKEVILMSLKNENETWSKIFSLLNEFVSGPEYQSLFYIPSKEQSFKDLTLGEARGKIVLLSRGESTPFSFDFPFEDNKTFSNKDFVIEDRYEPKSISEKIEMVKANLDGASVCSNGSCYVTFTSMVKLPSSPEKYALEGVDNMPGLNVWLKNYLIQQVGKQNNGIIVADFYDGEGNSLELADLVINSNFKK